MKKNKLLFVPLALTSLTLLSFLILSSSYVSADDDTVVDEINITVPASCTLSGLGMDSHATTLNNGTYASDIGTTTIKAFCNDQEGFAIYAIGYTDNTDGKNVMSSPALGSTHDIATGTSLSGNNSQWAMKLSTTTNPEPTYPITIQNNYNNYHTIPNEYELVAKRTAATDTGTNAIGSVLTSTYQIYVSSTQTAGTYVGQVKYVMVHPNTAPEPVGENQIGVIFDGNGLTFPGGATKNRVVYEESCEDEYGYVGDTPSIIRTTNLSDDGTKNSPYSNDEFYCEGSSCFADGNYYAEFEGASGIKLVIRYGLTQGTSYIDMGGGTGSVYTIISDDHTNRSGTLTMAIEGNYFSIYTELRGTTELNYDYGLYIQAYPIYDEPTEGATYDYVQATCSFVAVNGAYAETVPWYDYWHNQLGDNFYYETEDEYGNNNDGVTYYLSRNSEELKGTTITLYANFPYTITYDGNGATVGTMDGFYTVLSTDTAGTLLAYNYKKNNYGFAGWSTNQNAVVNGSDKIYGPTELVPVDDFSFNPVTHNATLYAVWVSSSGNLQNWGGCSSMNIGEVTALTDTRDNNTYAIAKLDDGKCWMMENLRLDPSNENTNINTNNTHNPTNTFLEERQSVIGAASTREECSAQSSDCFDQISFDSSYVNSSLAPNPDSLSSSWFGNGVLYNWYTSTAGHGLLYSGTTPVSGDICPSGWRMPSGIMNGDVYNLMSSLGTVRNVFKNLYEVTTDKTMKYPYNQLVYSYIFARSDGGGPVAGTIQTSSGSGLQVLNSAMEISSNLIVIDVSTSSSASAGGGVVWKNETYPVRCLTD